MGAGHPAGKILAVSLVRKEALEFLCFEHILPAGVKIPRAAELLSGSGERGSVWRLGTRDGNYVLVAEVVGLPDARVVPLLDLTLEDIRKHGHVLTPGRYVGAEAAEDDGEPFEEKMKRLTAALRGQQGEAARLDAAIAANLEELGYGG